MDIEVLHRCNLCDNPTAEVLDAYCNIVQCRACGYIFDNPRPTPEALVNFYSETGKYDSWLAEIDARERLWRRRISKLRATRKPGSLLDVGTGIGQFLAVARGDYSEVQGTEVSSSAVEIAKERYGLELFHGTIDGLAMTGRAFDNISLFHVLEHVPDPRASLRTCYSLLNPDGVLIVAVPNEVTSLRAILRRILVTTNLKKPGDRGKLGLPRIRLDGSISEIHLSHFTPKVLCHLIESTGFSILTSTLDPYYVRTGFGRIKDDLYYHFCLSLRHLFGVNVYDAILVIARKKPSGPGDTMNGEPAEQ